MSGRIYLSEYGADRAYLSDVEIIGSAGRPTMLVRCTLVDCDLSSLDPRSQVLDCWIEGGVLPMWMMPGAPESLGGLNVQVDAIVDTIRGNHIVGRLGPSGVLLR